MNIFINERFRVELWSGKPPHAPPHPQIGALAAKTLALFVRLESARYLLPVKEIVSFRNVGAHAHVGVGVLMGV